MIASCRCPALTVEGDDLVVVHVDDCLVGVVHAIANEVEFLTEQDEPEAAVWAAWQAFQADSENAE